VKAKTVGSVFAVCTAATFGATLAALTGVGCRGAAAREAERLPGRTRPLYEHNWSHPHDLRFSENRFTPADPKAAVVTTSSGLRAYVITAASEQVVQIVAAVPLGRSVEHTNEIGAAELISRLISQQINERLGSGFIGRVQADQDVDLTRFTLQVLAEDWQPALSALMNALRQPRLDPAAIDAYRTGAGADSGAGGRGSGRGVGQTGATRPVAELMRMLATYPLAPPESGLTVHREAVRSLAVRTLRPAVIALGIGGGVTRENVQRELESLAAGWQAPAGATSEASPAAATAVTPKTPTDLSRLIGEPGYTTWIAIGHPVPKIAAPDEAAVAVMTDVLNIRLNITVREVRGLANSTQLQIPATTRHEGLLAVRSGARPESVAPIIRFAKEELSRIREAGGAPTAEELEQVKGGLVLGKWQGALDGARAASATYANETARYGSLDHVMKWPEAVRAVTAQRVSTVAQKYVHPDQLGVVVIGQIDAVRKARHPRWPVALDEVLPASHARSNP
jgi:predicted Zn-dependent peptidase